MDRHRTIHKLAVRAGQLAASVGRNAAKQATISEALGHLDNAAKWKRGDEYDWQEAIESAAFLLDDAEEPETPTLETAVNLIAMNDDPGETRIGWVAGTVTVGIIATLFNTTARQVARQVVKVRKQYGLDR